MSFRVFRCPVSSFFWMAIEEGEPAPVVKTLDGEPPTFHYETVLRWERNESLDPLFPTLDEIMQARDACISETGGPPIRMEGVNLYGTLFGMEVL